MPIIEVDHVTKEFQLGELEGFKTALRNRWRRLRGQPAEQRPRFKALDDISFSVEPGEVLGIIGHNGAGKSTLLKLLAGISKPSSGRITARGRIAPLIEVGAGFIGQLTGRENVYLNGAILGMSKKEIDRKFDEIVDFSELAEFIDTPVKRYSSGMRVKLAFSVATSIDAEILILDEVLAVGDLAFQRKCFDRMESVIRGDQRTVLLVSHNIRQVQRLCSKVMLLDHGRIEVSGDPKRVCNLFYEASDKQILDSRMRKFGNVVKTSGDVELLSVKLSDDSRGELSTVTTHSDIELQILYKVNRTLSRPIFGVGFHTTDFLYLATSQSVDALSIADIQPGIYTLTYRIKRFPFLPGAYSLRLGVALDGAFQSVFYAEGVMPIQVVEENANRAVVQHGNEGFIALDGEWSLTPSVMLGATPGEVSAMMYSEAN